MSSKSRAGRRFVDEVTKLPNCDNIMTCIQCGTCTASCPVSKYMTYSPRQIFAMIRSNLKEEVLASDTIWYCASCYSCTVRCPKEIKITEAMYSLKEMAVRENMTNGKLIAPHFAKKFMNIVKRYGRIYEPELAPSFITRVGIGGAIGNAIFGLKMFKKGRMPILPKKMEKMNGFKKMIRKVNELRGAN